MGIGTIYEGVALNDVVIVLSCDFLFFHLFYFNLFINLLYFVKGF